LDDWPHVPRTISTASWSCCSNDVASAIRRMHALQSQDPRQLAHGDLDSLIHALAQVQEATLHIAETTRGMTSCARDSDSPLETCVSTSWRDARCA
jgi:hypothetical protein